MLPPDVEARVAAIAADSVSGASELVLRALEAFEVLAAVPRAEEELRELAARLAAAQPSMVAIQNVAHLSARLISEAEDPAIALREIRRELSGAQEKVARNAVKVMAGKPTIVTLSRSTAVLASLKLLQARNRLAGVFVLESRPRSEGRTTAEELAAAGIPTTLVADGLGPSLARRCDLALVGADSVLRDGALVNKIGSYGLALAARAAQRPFYVACEMLKVDAVRTEETFPPPAVRPEEELDPPPSVRVENVYFEITPAVLVTSYITDRGVYEPSRVAGIA